MLRPKSEVPRQIVWMKETILRGEDGFTIKRLHILSSVNGIFLFKKLILLNATFWLPKQKDVVKEPKPSWKWTLGGGASRINHASHVGRQQQPTYKMAACEAGDSSHQNHCAGQGRDSELQTTWPTPPNLSFSFNWLSVVYISGLLEVKNVAIPLPGCLARWWVCNKEQWFLWSKMWGRTIHKEPAEIYNTTYTRRRFYLPTQ